MITKEKLKEYAGKLLFDMEDEEYDTLSKEFEIFLKEMDYVSNMEGIKNIKPQAFPFPLSTAVLREDVVKETLTTQEALSNAKKTKNNEVSVPKVVGE